MTVELFEHALSNIKNDEELAYIMGVRKAEAHLLDKISYNIENSPFKDQYNIDYIKPEYNNKGHDMKRLDLGIFFKCQDQPGVICEAKYYYSSDCIFKKTKSRKPTRDEKWVRDDIEKLNKIQGNLKKPGKTEKIFLFFLAHFDSMELPEHIPYYNLQKRARENITSCEQLYRKAVDHHLNGFKDLHLEVKQIESKIGKYHNIPVHLNTMIIKIPEDYTLPS